MIDADDLALLATSFTAAMQAAPEAGAADGALFELGWGDVLAAAAMQGLSVAFASLGATGSAACLLDDVVAQALGIVVAPGTCVVMPAPQAAVIAGVRHGNRLVITGLVSSRGERARCVYTPVAGDDGVSIVSFDASLVRGEPVVGLDPDRPFRRVDLELTASDTEPVEFTGTWEDAVCLARVALAHQLIAASRGMLDVARQHAVDRVQFGRPIASFQALRHKPAESLAAIEGAGRSPMRALMAAIHCLRRRRSRWPARRRGPPRPMPNRCSPGSVSRPTIRSIARSNGRWCSTPSSGRLAPCRPRSGGR